MLSVERVCSTAGSSKKRDARWGKARQRHVFGGGGVGDWPLEVVRRPVGISREQPEPSSRAIGRLGAGRNLLCLCCIRGFLAREEMCDDMTCLLGGV